VGSPVTTCSWWAPAPPSPSEEQQVTVAGCNIGVEHGIRIVILRGPVLCASARPRAMTTTWRRRTLGTGTHSISITPTGDFFIRFFSRLPARAYVQSCTIEAAGVVTLPTPYGCR
jgi:hypothetical protein